MIKLYQAKIETVQLLDDVEYALRSIKVCGSAHSCVGVHGGQLVRGCAAAAQVLDSTTDGVMYSGGGHNVTMKLREAKAILRECVKDTNDRLREMGGVKQLRLAIAAAGADTHEMGLAA